MHVVFTQFLLTCLQLVLILCTEPPRVKLLGRIHMNFCFHKANISTYITITSGSTSYSVVTTEAIPPMQWILTQNHILKGSEQLTSALLTLLAAPRFSKAKSKKNTAHSLFCNLHEMHRTVWSLTCTSLFQPIRPVSSQ